MTPFIKLAQPQLKNLPTQAETQRFEEYMRTRVTLYNAMGRHFDGSGYFEQDDPEDLALVFEKTLAQWCKAHDGPLKRYATKEVSYKVDQQGYVVENSIEETYVDVETLREACEALKNNLMDTLNQAIRGHLERTGGKIGHFPYSGQRILSTYVDDDGTTEQLCLDPFELNWTGIRGVHLAALEETAVINDPRKRSAKKLSIQTALDKKRNANKRRLILSVGTFVAVFLGTMLMNRLSEERNLSLLLAAGGIISMSGFIALISFVSLLKTRAEINYQRYEGNYNPLIRDGFETHIANLSIGRHQAFLSIDKDRFAKDVKTLCQYYKFLEIWAEACGCSRNFYDRSRFYRKVSPFIIDPDNYF